jgi:hypothetical protein
MLPGNKLLFHTQKQGNWKFHERLQIPCQGEWIAIRGGNNSVKTGIGHAGTADVNRQCLQGRLHNRMGRGNTATIGFRDRVERFADTLYFGFELSVTIQVTVSSGVIIFHWWPMSATCRTMVQWINNHYAQ